MPKTVHNTDTHTEPAVIDAEYWTEEDKDTLPSNDDNGKFQGIVFRPGKVFPYLAGDNKLIRKLIFFLVYCSELINFSASQISK